ncbi:MAG: caspase family protein [Candidatus Sericytochromatia bacterium]|nr:caspase family protein [Candidatus Sericytochromatia bacterium]
MSIRRPRALSCLPLCLSLLLATGSLPARATPAPSPATEPGRWEPAKTYALLVGILEWQDKSGLASFPQKDRQDKVLQDQFLANGVPADHLVYLSDKAATGDAIRQAWTRLATQAGPGSTLIFYFAGHGLQYDGRTYLANYDVNSERPDANGIGMGTLTETLAAHWHGDRLLLLADCCHSGAMTEVVRAEAQRGKKAACLTSSTATNTSTGKWTFTEALNRLLSGDRRTDLDRDKRITFQEADTYVHREMKYGDDQLADAFRSPGFAPGFVLRGVNPDQVLPASLPGQRWKAGDYAECLAESKWWRVQVLAAQPTGTWVHYIGWADKWDAWVGADRLRPVAESHFAAGQTISAEWEDKWYAAKIIKASENFFYFIHYDGYDDACDEWVTAARIKAKP